MKARIIKSNLNQNNKIRLNPQMQTLLQNIENSFAKEYGITPRTVVYGPSNRAVNREIILNNLAEQNYPLNLDMGISFEEFKEKVADELNDRLEKELDLIDNGALGGFFNKACPDKIFILYNAIKDDLLLATNVLKHETLHAGIYDLIRGKISKLKVYKGKQHNSQFILNIITEHKMRFLIRNKNESIFSKIGSPDMIFACYSFEEEFVRYNTLCSMIEDEIKSQKINVNNIIQLVSVYINESGFKVKPIIDNTFVNLYGKQIPLKHYLPTYLGILRGPVEKYEDSDKDLLPVLENFNTENIVFDGNNSRIPDLADDLILKISQGVQSKKVIENILLTYKEDALNFRP